MIALRTVLVVDDDAPIRQAICLVLEDLGYPVVEAENGEVALRVMHASKDGLVVLLDLMMPRLGGREVLMAISDDVALTRHAVILLTAAGRTLPLAVVQDMGRLGVGMLGKPFDIDTLEKAVAAAARRVDERTGE